MNVKELKLMLDAYPDDMEVLTAMFSDYEVLRDIVVIEAVPQTDYVMRAHSTMSDENKLKAKKYLYI